MTAVTPMRRSPVRRVGSDPCPKCGVALVQTDSQTRYYNWNDMRLNLTTGEITVQCRSCQTPLRFDPDGPTLLRDARFPVRTTSSIIGRILFGSVTRGEGMISPSAVCDEWESKDKP